MRKLLFLSIVLIFSTVGIAQTERQTSPIRSQKFPFPQLMEFTNLHFAAGFAQAPQGYPVFLYELVPSQSLVGIYGNFLRSNEVSKLILRDGQGIEVVVDVTVSPVSWFKSELAVFRLPHGLYGEIWITATGRFSESNRVKIWVN